ncbi:MAG: phosphate ABC transporter substrate-binding protein, partial [Anaerolineae bacterium]
RTGPSASLRTGPFRLLISVVVFGSLIGCVRKIEPHPPVHLRLAGSTSMQPLMEALTEAYSSRHEYVTFALESGNSQVGLDALRGGAIDIALVSREMRPEEMGGLLVTPIARDGIAIVVNEDNPIGALTLEEIRSIFAGESLSWGEVGGQEGVHPDDSPPGDIQVVSREEGSGTRRIFEALVMEGKRVTSTAVVMPTDGAVGEYIAQEPRAIGYASMADLPSGVKALRIGGVEPSPATVSSGEYLLVRPFLLVTEKRPHQEVQAFIDFCLSPAGQAIVEKGYGRSP